MTVVPSWLASGKNRPGRWPPVPPPRRARTGFLLLAALLVLAAGCDEGTGPPARDALVERFDLRPLPDMLHPPENPPTPERTELGRLLFFDPILSGRRDAACSTCHLPELGFADGRDLPIGAFGEGLGPDRHFTVEGRFLEGRNAMTVINVGFNRFLSQRTPNGFMFWDGRRRRIEVLVVLPLLEITELKGDAYAPEDALDSVLARIRAVPEYRERFAAAYPDVAAAHDGMAVDSATFVGAVAQFVRSLESSDAPYDRFVAGDPDALTDQQKRGLVLFHTKGCAECHAGPMFSDFDFHVVGGRQTGPGFQETPFEDFGRWNATGLESDRWAFRTPSLRNVAHTAPYLHSGAYATLRDVVELFDRGGGDHPGIPADRLDERLKPLHLSGSDVDALVAFLESLSDLPDVQAPDRVPSGLPPQRLP